MSKKLFIPLAIERPIEPTNHESALIFASDSVDDAITRCHQVIADGFGIHNPVDRAFGTLLITASCLNLK